MVISPNQTSIDIPPEYYELTEHSKDVAAVIDKLSGLFEDEFFSIVDVILPVDTFKCSIDSFIKTYLSRYVEMSGNPSYYHFMLLCSLVRTTIIAACPFDNCFTFAKLISWCLITVFNRCYINLFEEHEEYESLGSYCRRINSILFYGEDGNLLPDIDLEEIRSLLESLRHVDCKNFYLTDFEEKLLKDTLNLVPSETSSLNSEIFLSIAYQSSDEDERPPPINTICRFCGRRCFKFLIFFLSEVRERINLSTLIRG
ncbi:hypothetical protein HNY73_008747 [Argiope bruennichi]|uniref:Uncharacterized protein n=1 Tax=Argiope bruennichi TaxID=94029 RepID=A0A8T0FCF9_ARGBR|nr:hypothetical protein HNY73_008747 [Argiope bruennichi]